MKKRFLVFLLAIVTVFTLTSCSKKFTVTFESDGSVVSTQEVKKNKTATKPSDPTKEGYEFVEWQLDGARYVFSTKVTKDITLKALWEKEVCKKHTYDNKCDPDCNVCGETRKVSHTYDNACDAECNKCGEKRDAGHQWVEATYTSPKHCPVCGTVEGSALVCPGHADANGDKKCDTCGQPYDASCSHIWEDATCTEPKTCTKCGATEGSAAGHQWVDATYSAPKTCKECGATEGDKLVCTDHVDDNGDNSCDNCGSAMKVQYEPRWQPNKQTGGWNGKNMTVKILVLPKSSYDPFDPGYSQSNKKIMQKQVRLVEAAYGIKIVFEDWPDAAPWGPTRVEYIKTKTQSGDFANEDVYVVDIASAWIPTLVKNGCLAELAVLDTENNAESGIFTEIGYQETYEGSGEFEAGTYLQNPTNNQVTSSLKKVYGYVQGSVRPDYFMYYNADMIADANMTDPAELWLRGEWTWSAFELYCQQLQAALPENNYALSVGFPEFVIGSVASTGGKIATTRPSLGLTSLTVIERFQEIQNLYASGCYENRNVEDVSTGFLEKRVAIVHGDLWFLGDASRFNPEMCDFTIGSVPYPTADGDGGQPIETTDVNEAIAGYNGKPIETEKDSGVYIAGVDMSNSSFAVPYGSTGCKSIIDTPSGKNGINNKIIFAILYDLYDGLGDDPEQAKVDSDTAYYNWLLTKFDRALYAEVIMSVQEYTYFELIELVSMTVGSGSHFGGNAFWPLASNICKNQSVTPATRLNEVVEDYYEAMEAMGYIVAH